MRIFFFFFTQTLVDKIAQFPGYSWNSVRISWQSTYIMTSALGDRESGARTDRGLPRVGSSEALASVVRREELWDGSSPLGTTSGVYWRGRGRGEVVTGPETLWSL